MRDVLIFGAGPLGRLAHDILRQQDARVIAFADDEQAGAEIEGVPVVCVHEAVRRRNGHAVVAIEDAATRIEFAHMASRHGFELLSAIHPLASIAPSARIGRPVLIGARATICVHAEIGDHCVISSGAIVEHDNTLGVGVFLAPAVRLAGGVTVEDFARLGIGSCVIPYRRIGRLAVVAPGSVVIRDVYPMTMVSGVPARLTRRAEARFVPDLRPAVPAAELAAGASTA